MKYYDPARIPWTRFFRRWVVVCVVIVCALAPSVGAAEGKALVVVLKEDLAPYNVASSGVTAAVTGAGVQAGVQEIILDRKAPARAAKELRAVDPRVVVTVGSSATRFMRRVFPDIPIVFAMIINPVQDGVVENVTTPGGNVTGAALAIPLSLQFQTFKDVAPHVRRLGVLSDPSRTGRRVKEAIRAAEEEGLTLVVENVSSAAEVPAALDRLLRGGIDGLWTVADPTVLSSKTGEHIIRACAKARIPTMGLSAKHCAAGFLFALALDYEENGRQAGALAARVAGGDDPGDLAIAFPEHVKLVLNLHIGKAIGHEFPPGVVKSAKIVRR